MKICIIGKEVIILIEINFDHWLIFCFINYLIKNYGNYLKNEFEHKAY